MKKYRITVNGTTYEVEVDEVASDGAAITAAPAVSAPVEEKKAAPASPVKPAAPGSNTIKSPMPGTILKVNCKKGDRVKKGDVVCVLEAMKMENDIMAPSDGVVTEVYVAVNAGVETGADLVAIG